jgi:Protein kinase domain/WD domain, G-beta repeat
VSERAPYEVLEELGRGGMGAVYRAVDRLTGRQVALKVVTHGARNASTLARFQREGQITAALDHPGILRVHAAGVYHNKPYLAYELVEGCRPLNEVLAEQDLTNKVRMIRDAARALGHAHKQGVLHRDVKPDNLLCDRSNRVRVADFGLATAQGMDRLTRTGAVLGTPTHMSPEQVHGDRDKVGPPTDVWSLGVVLYEALSGELPFQGGSFVQLAAQIIQRSPDPLPRDVPRPLSAVCFKALAKDPSQRYDDCDELACDLQRWLDGVEVKARPPSVLGRQVPIALVAVAALLLLGVIAALAWPDGASGDGSRPESSGARRPSRQATEPSRDAVDPAEALPGEGTPREVYLELAAWLADPTNATHPHRERLHDELAARQRTPLAALVGPDQGPTAFAAFREPTQVVLRRWREQDATVWSLAEDEQEVQPVWSGLARMSLGRSSGDRLLVVCPPLVLGGPLGGERPTPLADLTSEALSQGLWDVDRSPDGGWLVISPRGDDEARLLSLDGGASVTLPDHGTEVLFTRFAGSTRVVTGSSSQRHALIAWGPNNGVRFWEVPGGRLLVWRRHRAPVTSLAVSRDGQRIAVGDASYAITLYDPDGQDLGQLEGEDLHRLPGMGARAHAGKVVGLCFSPDGALLYSVSGDPDRPFHSGIRVWDLEQGQEVRRVVDLPRMSTLDISADGHLLVVGRYDGTVELWGAGR